LVDGACEVSPLIVVPQPVASLYVAMSLPFLAGQSHGANVALRGLPGKMPPMFRTVRCQVWPHARRTHVRTWALMFSTARLAAMSWRFGPQCEHTTRAAAVVASPRIYRTSTIAASLTQ